MSVLFSLSFFFFSSSRFLFRFDLNLSFLGCVTVVCLLLLLLLQEIQRTRIPSSVQVGQVKSINKSCQVNFWYQHFKHHALNAKKQTVKKNKKQSMIINTYAFRHSRFTFACDIAVCANNGMRSSKKKKKKKYVHEFNTQ